jgi:hypothetical protein
MASDLFSSVDEALTPLLGDAEKIVEALGRANCTIAMASAPQKHVLISLVSEIVANCARMRLLLGQLDTTSHTDALIRLTFPILAYLVRNLLELGLWVQFCSKSKGNAERFHQDRFRDVLGFSEALRRLAAAAPENASAADLLRAITSLKEAAEEEGIPSVNDRFAKVADAARELGLQDFYNPVNSVLSKFAHPTAMALLTPLEGKALAETFAGLFVVGVVLARTSLAVVRQHLESLGVNLA